MSDRAPDRAAATTLLERVCHGDAAAAAALDPIVYEQLRHIAQGLLRQERANHTLQPTALVHEAYIRLVDETTLTAAGQAGSRERFLGIAAKVMRRLLVEHARRRHALKRGGVRERIALDDAEIALPVDDETLLDLEGALGKLEAHNPRLARLAELRLFGGLSVRDVAPVLDVSLATAKADWALARAWLSKLLADGQGRQANAD